MTSSTQEHPAALPAEFPDEMLTIAGSSARPAMLICSALPGAPRPRAPGARCPVADRCRAGSGPQVRGDWHGFALASTRRPGLWFRGWKVATGARSRHGGLERDVDRRIPHRSHRRRSPVLLPQHDLVAITIDHAAGDGQRLECALPPGRALYDPARPAGSSAGPEHHGPRRVRMAAGVSTVRDKARTLIPGPGGRGPRRSQTERHSTRSHLGQLESRTPSRSELHRPPDRSVRSRGHRSFREEQRQQSLTVLVSAMARAFVDLPGSRRTARSISRP